MRGLLSLTLAALLSAGPAAAREFGDHGGYDVAAVESTSETDKGFCAMAEDDFEGPGGSRLRIYRYLDSPDAVIVTVDNYNWSTKQDQRYEVSYDLGEFSYERKAKGFVDSIHKGLMAAFPADDFLPIFAKSDFLILWMDDDIVDKLSLEGTTAATAAFAKCWAYLQADEREKQRERDRWKTIPKDPFVKAPGGQR